MKLFYNIKGTKEYIIKVEINNQRINDITCTCHHGSMYPDNYQLGNTLCWHIKVVYNYLMEKNKDKLRNKIAKEVYNKTYDECCWLQQDRINNMIGGLELQEELKNENSQNSI